MEPQPEPEDEDIVFHECDQRDPMTVEDWTKREHDEDVLESRVNTDEGVPWKEEVMEARVSG